jgi:hypothetical protein
MNLKLRFLLIGLLIAFLEEFITQGVLRRNLLGWIVPTLVAFLPFLLSLLVIRGLLRKRMAEPHAVLAHYLAAGGIGLAIEWFVIGLSPWSNPAADPLLMSIFQLGIFSFWGSVGFAPELLLDHRERFARVRIWFRRSLVAGFAMIYLITLSAPREAQFGTGIASVLLVFILLNGFYFRYMRIMQSQGPGPKTEATSPPFTD